VDAVNLLGVWPLYPLSAGGSGGGGLPLKYYFNNDQVNEIRRKFNLDLTNSIREDDELMALVWHLLDE
jgi:hypothetical protein